MRKKAIPLWRRLLAQWEPQSMVWLGIIFLFIFCYMPIYGVRIAFENFSITGSIGHGEFVGFKYFKQFLTDPKLPDVLRNTLYINIFALILGFPAPIILALLITELRGKAFKRVAQTVSYLPHFLSWAIFGGLVLEMTTPSGVVNGLLTGVGLLQKPVNFMGRGEYFYGVFTVASIIKGVGFSSILYVAAISSVPADMYEAAMVDGANRFERIRHVTIPSIMGTVVIMFIFQISAILNTGIEQLLILQNPINRSHSETLDTYTYRLGLEQMRFSYATAVGILKSLVAVTLLVGANTLSKKLTDKGLF